MDSRTRHDTTTAAVPDPREEAVSTGKPGTIVRVAGNGEPSGGDGGAALNAGMEPRAVVFGPDGSLYLSDRRSKCIRKIDASGTITRIAGNGESVWSGEGGAALNAGIGEPAGIAVDSDSNIYFCTDVNPEPRVARIDGTTQKISTFAGGGTGKGEHPTALSLGIPWGIVVTSGYVYFADKGRGRVWSVDRAGTKARLVAGNGGMHARWVQGKPQEVSIGRAGGLAFDRSGNLYISNGLGFVYKVLASGTEITTVLPFALEQQVLPGGVEAVCTDGAVVFGTLTSSTVFVRTPGSAGVETIAGKYMESWYSGDGGPAVDARLSSPRGTAFHNHDLFIADYGNNRVRKIVGVDKPVTLLDVAVNRRRVVAGRAAEVEVSWTAYSDRAVTGAQVCIDLPEGVEYVKSLPHGTVAGRTVTVPIGDLPVSDEKHPLVTMRVTAPAAGPLLIPARVRATETGTTQPVWSWTSFAGLIATIGARLSLPEGSAKPAQVNTGTKTRVRLSWRLVNDELADAENTKVTTSALPSGVAFHAASTGGKKLADNRVQWDLGRVPSSSSTTVWVDVDVETSSTGSLTVEAAPSCTNQAGPVPPRPVTITVVKSGALTLSGRASPQMVAGAAEGATWSWTVTNTTATAQTVKVTATLPAPLTFRRASAGGRPKDEGRLVEWDRVTVGANGATRTVEVTATVPAETTQTPVSASAELSPAHGTSAVEMKVPVVARAAMRAGAPTTRPGTVRATGTHSVDFGWTVTNTGPSTARKAGSVCTWPDNITYTEAVPAPTKVDAAKRRAEWDFGDLAPGAGAAKTVRFTGKVTPKSGERSVEVTAEPTSATAEPDGSTGRAKLPVAVQVVPSHTLGLSQWRTFPDKALPGGNVAVAFKIVNTDEATATNIKVKVKIPQGLEPTGKFSGVWNPGARELQTTTGELKGKASWWFTVILTVGAKTPSGTFKVQSNVSADKQDNTTWVSADVQVAPVGLKWEVIEEDVNIAAAGFGALKTSRGKLIGGIGGLFGGVLAAVGGLFSFLGFGFGALFGLGSLFGFGAGVLGGLLSLVGALGGALPKLPGSSGEGSHPDTKDPDTKDPDKKQEDKYKIARLELKREKVSPDPAVPGEKVEWRWKLTNTSKNDATSIAIMITLPEHTDYVSGAKSGTGRTAIHAIGKLQSGKSTTFGVVALVDPAATATLTATASLTSFRALPVSHSIHTELRPRVCLALPAGRVRPRPVDQGKTVTYSWTVGHTGPSAARSLKTTVTLPGEGLDNAKVKINNQNVAITGTTATLTLPGPLTAKKTSVPVEVAATVSKNASRPIPVTTTVEALGATQVSDTATAELAASKKNLKIWGYTEGPQAAPGEQITYVWTMANTGSSELTDAALKATIPYQATPVLSTGGIFSAGKATWKPGTLKANEYYTATATITVPTDTTDTTGDLTPAITAEASAKDQETVTSHGVSARLARAATVDLRGHAAPSPARVGTTTTYTFTAANRGPSTLKDAKLTVALSRTLKLVATKVDGKATTPGTDDKGRRVVSIGKLAPRATPTTITLECQINAGGTGHLRATAMLPTGTTHTTAHATAVIDSDAALTLEQTSSASTANAGAEHTLTWDATKTGAQVCCSPHLLIDADHRLHPVKATVNNTPYDVERVGGRWRVMLGTLLPNKKATAKITWRVAADTPAGTKLGLTARAEASSASLSTIQTHTITTTTKAHMPTLAQQLTTAAAGGPVRLQWALVNTGPSQAAGEFTVTLPKEIAFTQAHVNGQPVSATFSSGTHTVTVSPLAPNNPAQVMVTGVLAASTTATSLNVTATAKMTTPSSPKATCKDTVTVTRPTGMKLSQAVRPDPAEAGQTLTYVFTAANPGPSTSNKKKLTVTVTGTGTTVLAYSSGGTPNASTVSWDIDALAPGQRAIATLILRLAPNAAPPNVKPDLKDR